MLRIRKADNRLLLCADADARTIAASRFTSGAINLYQFGIVNIIAKSAIHGLQVSLVAVAGKLNSCNQSGSKVRDEYPRGISTSVPYQTRQN
jgi:hypothetical protein